MIKIKKYVGGLLICFLMICILGAIIMFKDNADVYLLPDLKIPEKTAVILHLSTLTDTTVNLSPKPLSQVYYYDEYGNILGFYEFEEEIVNDFILKGKNYIAFMMKNDTVLSNSKETLTIGNSSNTKISSINFGPSQVGYLSNHDVFFSLLNIGQQSGTEYINIIRFTSENKSYDVVVPYYLENISYDSERQQFICIVSDLNKNVGSNISLTYIVLNYDSEIDEFVQDANLHEIQHSNRLKDYPEYMFRTSLAHDNTIFSVSVVDTDDYLNNKDPNKIRTMAKLILCKYDMQAGTEEIYTLKDDYHLDELGYGVLSGSNNLPMEIIDDKLYVFSSDKEVFIIESEKNIKVIDIPYEFSGSLNLKRPLSKIYNDKENFFGSEIIIGTDGSIYILNLFENRTLTIHKLLDDSTYQKVWQSKLPPNVKQNVFINTYELLHLDENSEVVYK